MENDSFLDIEAYKNKLKSGSGTLRIHTPFKEPF